MSKQTELAQVADTITVDSGKVGIGTSSPTNVKLQINDSLSGTAGTGHLAFGETTSPFWNFRLNTSTADLMLDRSYGGWQSTPVIAFDRSGGSVTMPYQPAFMAYAGGDRFFSAPQSTWTDLNIFDSINHNIGNHYNSTTDNFTCPVSGVYHFYVNVREETYYGSWGGIHIQLVNNGSRFAETRKWDGYQNEETLTLSITRQFSANDVVGVRVHSDSSDTDLSVEGGSTTFFGGHLLG
jgi:hypothetical protein